MHHGVIGWYVPELGTGPFQGLSLEFRAVRAGNLRLIRSLEAAERRRVGLHSERGEEAVEHLIRMYAGHDLLHLNQIARIRETLGSAAPA